MDYRDRYRQASFRGVEFWVDDEELDAGKRVQVDQYPLRDDHWIEELGANADRFPVTAHLIGSDVFEQRDRLLTALRRSGPGRLVLPTRGDLIAYAVSFRNRESIGREGRVSRISILFVEAGRSQFPDEEVDTAAAVRTQAEATLDASADQFVATYQTRGFPAWLADTSRLQTDGLLGGIKAAIAQAAAPAEEVSSAMRRMTELQAAAQLLVLDPPLWASGVHESFRLFADLTADADAPYVELTGALRELVPARVEVDWLSVTPSRTQANRNHDAIRAATLRAADIEATRVMLRRELVSADDALSVRDELATSILADMDAAGAIGEDLVYGQLREHLGRVVQDLNLRSLALPRRSLVTPESWVPAVLFAYQVHGDVSREDQIVARNRIVRPGFLPGGVPVEVLLP
jgi:prophage DNA circulation protein